ncbi:porin [Caballeronia sp. LZ065]|uniref:porin n=1 Tax=Caballeronia sp. LZ065 TaxID=3038571 RepID=UPI003857ECF6
MHTTTNDRRPTGALRITAMTGALLCAAGAHAQSSVTLYGIVDAGVEHVNNTAAGGAQTRVVSGNSSGSRWGLKGVEDLGGGVKAVFTLEDGFNINDGATAQSTKGLGANAATTTRLFGRQAWVGIAAKGQRLTLGRQNTLLYDQAIAFDPMAVSSRYSALSVDYAMSARADNSVKYLGSFGAFKAAAMYSTRYDTGYGAEVPGAQLTGRYFGGSLTYGAGPLAASVSYEQRNSNTVTTNTARERRATAALSYEIGALKAFAGYRYLQASRQFLPASPIALANGSDASSASMYWLGGRYPVTPAFFVSAAGYLQDVNSSDADPWLLVLRADYLLSKRTDIYATAGYTHNEGNSALGVGGYRTVAAGYDQTGFVIGMRQRF